MQNLTQPTTLLKPFADQGDKNILPVVNSDPAEPQRADLTSGFPAIVSLPPDQGGLPPERKDFNALGYLTTTYDYFYQAGGTFTYNPTIATAIGGYPAGARLWFTNSDGVSMILRSTIDNNTNNFITDESVIGRANDNKPWVIENFMGNLNGMALLSYQPMDHELNDPSWLKSETWSWQSGDLYIAAYNYLEDEYNNGTQMSDNVGSYNIPYTKGPSGIKIVSSANSGTVQDIYEETGEAWYYIIDTIGKRFKLPRTNSYHGSLIKSFVYNNSGYRLYADGYCEQWGKTTGYNSNSKTIEFLVEFANTDYNVTLGSSFTGTNTTTSIVSKTGKTVSGFTLFDSNNVNFETYWKATGFTNIVNQLDTRNKYLYFYVGNTIRNETSVDVGELTEALNLKFDRSDIVVVSELPANPQTGIFYFIEE